VNASRTLGVLLAVAIAANPLAAQRPDTLRVPGTSVVSDTVTLKPPITPRRAFFYSFLAPGYSQALLGRHKAAVAFMFVEAMSIVMIRESGADVHEARRFGGDSVVVSYDASGRPVYQTARFADREIRTREAHVEDWAALLVANHLFAGADAFVAANLWDIGIKLGMQSTPAGRAFTVTFRR